MSKNLSETQIINRYDLPQGWIEARLGDITHLIRGASPRPKGDPRYFGGKIPCIMISDINREKGKYISKTRDTVTEEGARKSRYLKVGTLILSNSATICVPKILQVDACIHDGFVAFPHLTDKMNILYMYYYFDYIRPKITQENKQGVTQVNLNTNIVKNIVIRVPPLQEQHRIVSKLEELFTKLDEGVNALKKTKALLKNYRQSVLRYAFQGKLTEKWREIHQDKISTADILKKLNTIRREKGKKDNQNLPNTELYKLPIGFTWTNIGNIQTFIGSGITPRGGKSVYVKEGIPFIRSQNVYPDGLRLADIAYVTPELHETMSRTHVEPGDVLLNITGASIGRSTHIPDNFKEANVNQHVCIIRTGPWIIPKYLSYWLNSPFAQDVILTTNVGVTRQGLNYVQIRSLPIPFTSIEDQGKIVEEIELRISVVDTTEKIVNGGLRQSERLHQSILNAAFKGKLAPQDPNDEPASILLERMREEKAKRGIMQKVNESTKNKTHTKQMRLV